MKLVQYVFKRSGERLMEPFRMGWKLILKDFQAFKIKLAPRMLYMLKPLKVHFIDLSGVAPNSN